MATNKTPIRDVIRISVELRHQSRISHGTGRLWLTLIDPFLGSCPGAVDSWSSYKHFRYTQRKWCHTLQEVTPPLEPAELARQFSWSVPGGAETLHQFDCLFEYEVPLVRRHLGRWFRVFRPTSESSLTVHPIWKKNVPSQELVEISTKQLR